LTIAVADSFVPDFHGDQDQALNGMEDGGTGKPARLFWRSWFSACQETALRGFLLIILS